ncbi:hypothetical protein QMK19_33940 [Streptomyces sp. H10-C2]|uniref:hypothetical protein n=1 Tax=unclassified Streptomyces TaxID=2593676 RepID=UPI0024B90CA0|nr:MULTISPECIES: hypothetical protein [unclassified Streptomyces]MDJ0345550.1 hypothetical protein [Streptomyces sp. PH10-H1]MDJ0374496.1 hypothetical protein [Streptomyces sp. H10-C2]
MNQSANPVKSAWSALIRPDTQTVRLLRNAPPNSTELVTCGTAWDALVIAPLERGLAALDALELPHDRGYPVIADYTREELILLVAPGSAHGCTIQGVRVLSRGSWLLTPVGVRGSWSATWLSRPAPDAPCHYVDADDVQAALVRADTEQSTDFRRSP